MVDDEDGGDELQADIDNLQGLQKVYEAAQAQLGTDDAMVKGLRARLDAARAKQRASKPILQQVQQAQRRAGRLERQLEAAKKVREDLEEKRKVLLAEIDTQDEKVSQHKEEVERARSELGKLLEKAKAEQGGATEAQDPPPGPAKSSMAGAVAAWKHAKEAIELQLCQMSSGDSQELSKQIKGQYDAMEGLLNKLPQTASVGPGVVGGGKPMDAGADQANLPASTTTNRDGDAGANEEDDEPNDMLDLDASTIERLALALRTDGEDGAGADGVTNDGSGGDGAANGGSGGGISAGQMQAARNILKKVPIRRTPKRGGNKSK